MAFLKMKRINLIKPFYLVRLSNKKPDIVKFNDKNFRTDEQNI